MLYSSSTVTKAFTTINFFPAKREARIEADVKPALKSRVAEDQRPKPHQWQPVLPGDAQTFNKHNRFIPLEMRMPFTISHHPPPPSRKTSSLTVSAARRT